jgi:threonine/homoserine/homoserine lactone efflux protein
MRFYWLEEDDFVKITAEIEGRQSIPLFKSLKKILRFFSMLAILLKSILIGISVAMPMPIGPISTLAIKNCLTRGFAIGFATAMGASITEGFYGFVATGGLSFISHFLTTYANEVRIVSGMALIALAIYEIATAKKLGFKESEVHPTKKSRGFIHTMFFTTFLTLGSPMTIALFIGIFASMGEQVLSGQEMAITVFWHFPRFSDLGIHHVQHRRRRASQIASQLDCQR